jgi:MoaA/NifB/PqqE/SkfB family radical SAM enzyme
MCEKIFKEIEACEEAFSPNPEAELCIRLGHLYRKIDRCGLAVEKFKLAAEISEHKDEIWFKNRICNEIELSQKKTTLKSKPRMLYLIPTTECNINCVMCTRILKGNITVPVEVIEKCSYLFPYLEVVDWQGGEVFLLDYFKDMYMEISRYPQILQRIITSGLLIDKEWAKIFNSTYSSLEFSIDGITEKTYESIRRNARFKDLLKSIDLVNSYRTQDSRLKLSLTAIVMRRNLKELHLFPKFCKEHGFQYCSFIFLQPRSMPSENIFLRRDKKALDYLQKVISQIEEDFKKYNIRFGFSFSNFLAERKNLRMKHSTHAQDKLKIKCYRPWQRIVIDYRGRVRPDCLCKEYVGNIFNDEINELWNNNLMQQYRKRIIEGNMKNWCSRLCRLNVVKETQLTGD